MRDILRAALNPAIKEITLCTGAQLGKSTCLLLITLLALEFRAGACLWLLPTDNMARRAVMKRILPLIECNPQYEKYMPFGQVSYADCIPFKGMPLYYSGMMRSEKLSSIPVNLLIIDEAAKAERGRRNEADTISLAKERTKSFADALIIQASTPNVLENKFYQTYLEGSQSHYFMPCPHCKEFMEFIWDADTVRWDDGKPETARIICPHCKGEINDKQRREMMAGGKWIDTNPTAREQGKLSFHLNSMYSNFISIEEMAQKYHDAAHSLQRADELQNFQNSWLALPYEHHLQKVYDADIQALISPLHHRGQLPLTYQYLVLGVDIGQNESHWVCTAICDDGRFFIVDWGELMNFQTTPQNMGVSALFDSLEYHDDAGNVYRPDFAFIDSGYATNEVYQECMRAAIPGSLIPVKGSAGTMGAWAESKIRTLPDASFSLIVFSDFQAKRALYLDLVRSRRLILPAEADAPLIKGLSG